MAIVQEDVFGRTYVREHKLIGDNNILDSEVILAIDWLHPKSSQCLKAVELYFWVQGKGSIKIKRLYGTLPA